VADRRFDIDAYERRSREGPRFVCLIADGDANQRADNEVIFEDDEVLVFLDRLGVQVWTNFVISSGARRGTPDETEARSRARRLAWWSTRGFSAREGFPRWCARAQQ
jgi:hypothetical protein